MMSSCFLWTSTQYPDMVEYTEDEVLAVAKEKYGVTEWILTGAKILGETLRDADGNFRIDNYGSSFGADFVNGDNIEVAMTAFTGKNGGHDIQGMYSIFLSYVAIAKCSDGSVKYIYYNTNIHKDAKISDTIGASDYVFDVLPTEINDDTFAFLSDWNDMNIYLNNHFKGKTPAHYDYSGDRLKLRYNERYHGFVEMEFYKENGEIVFDIYYDKDENGDEERRLVYSSSDRYGVIYNYYGLDKSLYLDINYTVTQSSEMSSCMLLKGYAEIKEIPGRIIYSELYYQAEYKVLRDGEVINHVSSDTVTDKTVIDKGYLMDKIDGIDHTETATFTISDFYIFYEKEADTLKN